MLCALRLGGAYLQGCESRLEPTARLLVNPGFLLFLFDTLYNFKEIIQLTYALTFNVFVHKIVFIFVNFFYL